MTKTADLFQMIKKLDARLSHRSPNIACDRYITTFGSRGGPNLCGDNRSLVEMPTDGELPSSGLQDGRMLVVDRSIADSKASITYSGAGIGYADDPSEDDGGNALADAGPIVTMSINRARMRAVFLRGGRIPLPGFSYSQTLADGDGAVPY